MHEQPEFSKSDITLRSVASSTDLQNDFVEEKQHTEITAKEYGDSGSLAASSTHTTDGKSRQWKTTYLRLAPLAGILCILMTLASMVTALGILVGSHDQPVESWTVQPSAYLAMCAAIANQSMRFAAFHGLVTTWWLKALQGSTLAQLHWNWRAGTTVGGAIMAGRNMGLLGLACISSTLIAIDAPLLQKATTVVPANPVTLNVTMAQELPTAYSGTWSRFSAKWSPLFNESIPSNEGNISNQIYSWTRSPSLGVDWIKNMPISGVVSGCPDSCKARIRAPALAVTSCKKRSLVANYTLPLDTRNLLTPDYTVSAPPLDTFGFLVDVSLILDDQESLNLITGYSRSEDCKGTFEYTICTLQSAVGEYEVLIDHDTVTLAPTDPTIISLANNTLVNRTTISSTHKYGDKHPSTLSGVVALASIKYSAAVCYFTTDGIPWEASYGDDTTYLYLNTSSLSASNHCASYLDPQKHVVRDLNKLMFHLGAAAMSEESASHLQSHLDPGLPLHTKTTGHLQGSHNIFHTNLHWFGAAAVIELLCIVLVIPTYYGWWRLGRPVSFSPLEIAKA